MQSEVLDTSAIWSRAPISPVGTQVSDLWQPQVRGVSQSYSKSSASLSLFIACCMVPNHDYACHFSQQLLYWEPLAHLSEFAYVYQAGDLSLCFWRRVETTT